VGRPQGPQGAGTSTGGRGGRGGRGGQGRGRHGRGGVQGAGEQEQNGLWAESIVDRVLGSVNDEGLMREVGKAFEGAVSGK
jgi:hypothetical protein